MLKLYLLRHGESAWNQLHLYTGKQDVPLSEDGRIQAQRAAERFVEIPVDAIYASSLQRARETGRAIAEYKELPLHVDARLVEIDHGAWEGLTSQQVQIEYADEYALWRTTPHLMTMPRGESLDDVAQRVDSFLQALLAQYAEGNVVIASHDAVLRMIILRLLGLEIEHFWKWRFDNASLTVLEQWSGENFRLASLNDTQHLEGIFTNCEAQAL